jgi:hypothetical protein
MTSPPVGKKKNRGKLNPAAFESKKAAGFRIHPRLFALNNVLAIF